MITKAELTAQMKAAIGEQIEEYVEHLVDEQMLDAYETQAKQWAEKAGHQMMQATMEWVTAQNDPPRQEPCSGCGHRPTRQGPRTKQVRTLVGKIALTRWYYYCPACHQGRLPLDEQLGIMQTQTSAGVQREVSWRVAEGTMETAAGNFCRALPVGMSARQVEALMLPVGQALAAEEDVRVKRGWDQARQPETTPAAPRAPQRWYVELDGIFVRMRRGSVPFRPEERGRKGDVYREVKVGAVARAERGRALTHLAEGVRVDTVTTTRYVARRTSAEQFGPLLYALLSEVGYQEGDEVIVLGDGAHWIGALAQEHFPEATQIVDLFHAAEHLWKVAHTVFGPETTAANTWVEPVLAALEQGAIAEVLEALTALPPVAPAPGQARSVPEVEADYFRFHAARMQYARFRERGLMMGSGIAEAGCQSVVGTRLKRPGMRWTPTGLDAVLPVRTAVLNDTFDPWWQSQHRCLVA